MPAATRTIVAPLPNDPRVMTLAKSLGLSRREAFACCCEAWAWLSVMAVDGIVGNAAPDTVDGIVDVVGFGQAMLEARLVGVADDGLVVPSELRVQRERGVGPGSSADDDQDDDRRRKSDRDRQRRHRLRKTLTEPAARPSPPPEPAGPRPAQRHLGAIAGHGVRLLFSRQGVPFYKLLNAQPREFTGSVTDPENPSLEDATTAIYAAMLRESKKGLGTDGESFKPALSSVAAAAGIVATRPATTSAVPQPEPATSAVPPRPSAPLRARRMLQEDDHESAGQSTPQPEPEPEGAASPPVLPHRKLRRIRAWPDDSGDASNRDSSVTGVTVTRDAVTVTELSRENGRDSVDNSSDDKGLRSVTTHERVTDEAPSSISSSFSSPIGEEKKSSRESSCTREDADAGTTQPQGEPGRDDSAGDEKTRRRRQRFAEYAAALETTIDTVEYLSRFEPDILWDRLKLAGITPGASSKPAGGQPNGKMTTEPMEDDKPVAGILVAPAADDHDRDRDDPVTISHESGAATSVTTMTSGSVAELANALG
jgi:hypothetical protein